MMKFPGGLAKLVMGVALAPWLMSAVIFPHLHRYDHSIPLFGFAGSFWFLILLGIIVETAVIPTAITVEAFRKEHIAKDQ